MRLINLWEDETPVQIDLKTVNEVLACAESWVPSARLIGNVRAGDIAAMCRAILEEGQKETTCPVCKKRCAVKTITHCQNCYEKTVIGERY